MIFVGTFVGQRIRDVRTQKGISQRSLARAAGLSQESSISNYECFRAAPSLDALCRIAQAMGVDVCELLPSLDDLDAGNGPIRAAVGRANGKLSQDKADQIRSMYSAGGWSFKTLSERFGVSASAIDQVVNFRTWA